jgi:hypothetical protein
MRLPADPRTRALVIAGGGLLAVFLVIWALDRLTPSPRGPASSSYATSPSGLAAYASVLERSGLKVRRLRRPVKDAPPPAGETLVVLDPTVVDPAEARAIADLVRRGGRLVAGGSRDASWLDPLLGDAPRWRPGAGGAPDLLAPAPETAGVRTLSTGDAGGWHKLGGTLPVVGPAKAPLLVVARPGRGSVALLADATPLQNRELGEADNAVLGVDLAGGRPVAFLETVHGYGAAQGLAGLPRGVRWALLGLLLAGLVGVWSAGKRFGPPEDEERALPPARTEYVDALAAALARTASEADLREAAGVEREPEEAHT